MNQYTECLNDFKHYMKINGFLAKTSQSSYTFGGKSNQSFKCLEIEFPYFDYDKIRETDFFENQKNYDLSICKSNRGNKTVVLVYVLLKNLYTDSVCDRTEFIVILNKLRKLKKNFLSN